MSSAALAGCANEEESVPSPSPSTPKRALFVVSNIEKIPAPGGGERSSGVWFSEVVHPYWTLQDSTGPQFQITLASPDGGRAAIDGFSVKLNLEDYMMSGGKVYDSGDPDNERFLTSQDTRELLEIEDVTTGDGAMTKRYAFKDTLRLGDVNTADYDVVFYAGGNAAPFQFVDDAAVRRVATEMYDDGKLVTAVCHGTAALLDVEQPNQKKLVEGRKVTGFSTAEEDALGQREVMPVLLEQAFAERGAIYSAGAAFTEHVIEDGRLITGQNPPSGRGVGEAIVRYFSR
ncbi:MAG: type 1 glutamine amidotransferase domain-containing protein [Byssovorax sp.]